MPYRSKFHDFLQKKLKKKLKQAMEMDFKKEALNMDLAF